ncbi:putative NmrA-like domain-containing protein [Seiridium unicorne]|uniref:NmrA-like domain-containing protein n=1 Tax=Seiridium unicorne TaxID=138068 RepID=A0ABR2UGD5_9PEZI
MPALSFLDIPRKLRDFIYKDYLTIDGGYHFNFKTGKLEPAKPGQQPLNLALTCSLIAAEIKGLALTHNVISFSTVGGCRVSAFRFERMIQYTNRHRAQMRRLNLDMDPAIVELVYYRKPWAIPSLVELDRMADVLTSTLKEECCVTWPKVWTAYEVRPYDGWDFYHLKRDDRSKYKYSAAAAAIFFLEANPGLHCHIRRIVLDEDCESVNHPPRHAKGLIRFTEANPRLRIEWRLSLWTNVFLATDKTYSPYDRFDIASSDERHTWGLGWSISGLSLSVYDWIEYAVKLPSNFSTVFDGSPSPDLAAEIFRDVLVRDAVL